MDSSKRIVTSSICAEFFVSPVIYPHKSAVSSLNVGDGSGVGFKVGFKAGGGGYDGDGVSNGDAVGVGEGAAVSQSAESHSFNIFSIYDSKGTQLVNKNNNAKSKLIICFNLNLL